MSIFGDYKAYRKYNSVYPDWKRNQDLTEAKRQEYLRCHPEETDEEDIHRAMILLRAIDIMDEYSQERSEDMEIATETVVGYGVDMSMLGGAALGGIIGSLNPVQNCIQKFFGKSKYAKNISMGFPSVVGCIAGMVAAFPLYALAVKAEVVAARHGRFEAMRKDLSNPKGFAVLTEEQFKEAEKIAENIDLDNDSRKIDILHGINSLKEMASDSKIFNAQKAAFDAELKEIEAHLDDEMTEEEILQAKKDQQILTKLVEKIDIASHDYAENAEMATESAISCILALGTLFSMALGKFLEMLKIKSASKIATISQIATIAAPVALSIASAQIQKNAAKVGRFKIKQDLLNNSSELVYVPDEKIENINNIKPQTKQKDNVFKFLLNVWKDNKEYNDYQKNNAKKEEKMCKAIESLNLSEEQIRKAKILQRNTFKTFNKVDESSQQYSESIDALGHAASLPVSLIFSTIGLAFGAKFLTRSKNSKNKLNTISNITNYVGIMLLSTVPSILLNAAITKEQKKAARIADMLAINELQKDYRQFR